MIQVKDEFISIKDIKHIRHERCYYDVGQYYINLIIEYMFNDNPIKIHVDEYLEYELLANKIKDAVNKMEEK